MSLFKVVKNILGMTALVTVSFGIMGVDSASASEISFECKLNNEQYTTMVLTKAGEKAFLRWNSSLSSLVKQGYTDQKRCEQVTGRLNELYAEESPYLTHGIINNLPVICTTDVEGGDCSALVYTLKPNQNGEDTLDQILAFDAAEIDVDEALDESFCPLYIGFNKNGTITGSRACEPKHGIVKNVWNSVTDFFN